MWTMIAKIAFSVLISAVGKIPPDQWAKLGTLVQTLLQRLADNLPVGSAMAEPLRSAHGQIARAEADRRWGAS